jgi:hypothetical protein
MTAKLHEVLAAEDTVVQAAAKMVAETGEKFNKHTEFFTGTTRTLKRLTSTPEDEAMEAASRKGKNLPTTVPATVDYAFGYIGKMLDLKYRKHTTNQKACADIVMDGKVVLASAPVDFLLDLEKMVPQWRELFSRMPTLDPSREWIPQQKGIWKTKDAQVSSQTEKQTHPVVLSPATDKHPAQVKEASKDVVVGLFTDITFSGAATTQQKADIMALCDRLYIAAKEARMRANSVDASPSAGAAATITGLFTQILNT